MCGWLPLGADPLVGRNVNCVCDGLVAHSQAQVSYGAGAILFYQNVLGFQITVGNARLSYRAKKQRHENWILDNLSASEISGVIIY